MDDISERVRALLIKRHLGKRGIHGIKVDETAHAVEIYIDEEADLQRATASVQKDSPGFEVRVTRSRKAELA